MSRRIKISFETINNGNYTVIDHMEVYAANDRIQTALEPKIKEYKKKEAESIKDAASLVLTR